MERVQRLGWYEQILRKPLPSHYRFWLSISVQLPAENQQGDDLLVCSCPPLSAIIGLRNWYPTWYPDGAAGMARTRNKLTARAVEALAKAGTPGKHGDGGGLYLRIDGARRSWIYLYTWRGKPRVIGLGGHPRVPLQAARRARDRAEHLLRQGINPAEAGKPHGV